MRVSILCTRAWTCAVKTIRPCQSLLAEPSLEQTRCKDKDHEIALCKVNENRKRLWWDLVSSRLPYSFTRLVKAKFKTASSNKPSLRVLTASSRQQAYDDSAHEVETSNQQILWRPLRFHPDRIPVLDSDSEVASRNPQSEFACKFLDWHRATWRPRGSFLSMWMTESLGIESFVVRSGCQVCRLAGKYAFGHSSRDSANAWSLRPMLWWCFPEWVVMTESCSY